MTLNLQSIFYLFFKYLHNYKKGDENLNPGSLFKGD